MELNTVHLLLAIIAAVAVTAAGTSLIWVWYTIRYLGDRREQIIREAAASIAHTILDRPSLNGATPPTVGARQ